MITRNIVICGGARLNITGCYWCGEREAICTVCHSKAARIRASVGAWLNRTATYEQSKAAIIDMGLSEDQAIMAMVEVSP